MDSQNWRKIKIAPSEQLRLRELYKDLINKHGKENVIEELEYLLNELKENNL